MPAPATANRSKEPTIFQRYSPRGECPLSFVGSALLHIGLVAGLIVLAYFGLASSSDSAKPPEMDVVEIEGGGGQPDGVVGGKGPGGSGEGSKRESAGQGQAGKPRVGEIEVKDFKFDKLTKKDFKIEETTDPIDGPGDVFTQLDREQRYGKKIIENESGTGNAGGSGTASKGAPASLGKGGGTGGGEGTGVGKAKGPGQGTSPKGVLFTDQRRRELRWQILASTNGEVHLKKLQALQVTLLIPLQSQPGFMLRYDLSKPTLVGDRVRAEDDSKKVRWKNANHEEMVTLAQVLKLQEVPQFTVIYLPSGLEADMARKELAYECRRESDILKTVWDVRERDGAYENEPYIVKQYAKPGVR
jgi:hypothetical protein